MDSIFDDKKNIINVGKHGISLHEATKLWNAPYIIIPAKNVVGENRWAILGKLNNRMHIAIFTIRNSSIRIISCHRADRKLEKIYYEKTSRIK